MSRDDWRGLVSGRSDPSSGPSIVLLGAHGSSWSSPVRVSADDKHDYFVKFAEACPDPQDRPSIVIELVAVGVGRLIGAPVVEGMPILIPDAFIGQEFKPGSKIESKSAYASRALEHCDENGRPNLVDRARDDNARRHVGAYAMFDWLCGCDQQWLYDIDDDRRLYSHDHGLYLPPLLRGYWDEAEMQQVVSLPAQLPDSSVGLDGAAVTEVANALRAVTRAQIAEVLKGVPASWAATDEALEVLGWFLEERAPDVADRLEQMTI